MSQAWVQVVGIVVEFLGVLLLAWEWFAARRQDLAEQRIAAEHARREESRASLERVQGDNPQMQRHWQMTRDMDRRMTSRRVDDARQQFGGLRGRAVALSLLLVTIGVVLQLVGTVPGCCLSIGVQPAG